MLNETWQWIIALVAGYLLGSVPIGLFTVRLTRGIDVRQVGSGRIGGTNVLRAAGWEIALLSGILDVLKAALAVLVARWLTGWPGGPPLLLALAGVMAILGHNYSIFLGFKGGAGTGSSMGGAIALWPWSGLITIPLLLGMILIIRRASLGSIILAFVIPVIFAIRAAMGLAPWAYVVYGVLTSILTLWALRPNIKRLLDGDERIFDPLAGRKEKDVSAD